MMKESVTLKEIYERLVQIEVKFDIQVKRNNRFALPFWIILAFVTVFEMINFIFNYIMFLKIYG